MTTPTNKKKNKLNKNKQTNYIILVMKEWGSVYITMARLYHFIHLLMSLNMKILYFYFISFFILRFLTQGLEHHTSTYVSLVNLRVLKKVLEAHHPIIQKGVMECA